MSASTAAVTADRLSLFMQKLRDYTQFLKIRLATLVVFSSGIGYAIAAGGALM